MDLYTIYKGIKPKNIRKLNALKMKIEKKTSYENIHKKRKLSKTIYENNPTYFLYIPNSAKYKHISYQKECLFNKEFHLNKRMNKKNRMSLNKAKKTYSDKYLNDANNINTINYLIKTQKNFFNNSDLYFLSSNDNLKTKSNKIMYNLKEIKSLLTKDRNYTSKTINKANNKYHENERINQDQKLMEKVMKDDRKKISKIKEIRKKRKNRKINEKNNIFSTLKRINEGYEKNKKIFSEMNNQFTRSLKFLCKNEKKENEEYQRILKNNYHLKIESEDKDDEMKKAKENIENGQLFLNVLNNKIKKKCTQINNIIDESRKKYEDSKI